jgi:hypothetical protein
VEIGGRRKIRNYSSYPDPVISMSAGRRRDTSRAALGVHSWSMICVGTPLRLPAFLANIDTLKTRLASSKSKSTPG